MYKAGVLTTVNSDDNERARRLNTDAARTMRYGGVPEEEALRMVTLNAAKQLGIDKWTGSLDVGKDADVVIWSAYPLSSYAIAEKVFIDGEQYFDRQEAIRTAEADAKEKEILRARLKAAGEAKPAETKKPEEKKPAGGER